MPNHPVVGVTWYEALAYTRWLSERWQALRFLPYGWQVELPSEAEWEKAARGGLQIPSRPVVRSARGGFGPPSDGLAFVENPHPERIYPWGDRFVADRANSYEAHVGQTSAAAGCFPRGASPYGVLDLSGNVWDWTRSCLGDYPYPDSGEKLSERENLKASYQVFRVLRGGSFFDDRRFARCAVRVRRPPDLGLDYFGFRVVVSPIRL